MRYRDEFPDFPEAEMPAIPEGFEDSSWHNDACPAFVDAKRGLILYVERAHPADRESGGPRFVLGLLDADGMITPHTRLATDDWAAVVNHIEAA